MLLNVTLHTIPQRTHSEIPIIKKFRNCLRVGKIFFFWSDDPTNDYKIVKDT